MHTGLNRQPEREHGIELRHVGIDIGHGCPGKLLYENAVYMSMRRLPVKFQILGTTNC